MIRRIEKRELPNRIVSGMICNTASREEAEGMLFLLQSLALDGPYLISSMTEPREGELPYNRRSS